MKINTRLNLLFGLALVVIVLLASIGLMGLTRLNQVFINTGNTQSSVTSQASPDLQSMLDRYTTSENAADFERDMRLLYNELERNANENKNYTENSSLMLRNASGIYTVMRNSIIAVSLMGILAILLFTLSTSRSISSTLFKITEKIKELASGKLGNYSPSGMSGEIGQLEAAVAELSRISLKWKEDISALNKKHMEGDTDAMLDERGYDNEYREITKNINALIQLYNQDMTDLLTNINLYGQGDFNTQLKVFPGKKNRYNQSINGLRDSLLAITGELKSSINAHTEGRAPSSVSAHFKGEWLKLMRDLNGLGDTWGKPVRDAGDIINRMAAGDFSNTMNGEYKGDINALKQAVNKANTNMSGYIKDIAALLSDMAADTTRKGTRREFTGPFPAVRDAFRSVENRISQLEKQQEPEKPTQSSLTGRVPITRMTASAARSGVAPAPAAGKSNSTFTSAIPVISARTLVAPNASHIYDNKDFGKYK